jgi:hypothetical protein
MEISGNVTIQLKELSIELIKEAYRYDPKSADGIRKYQQTYDLSDGCQSSAHGVVVSGDDKLIASAVILAGGGASTIHAHSAFVQSSSHLLLAVGPHVACLALPNLDLVWATKTDSATCFGVHPIPHTTDFISHGELEISRLNRDGKILWQNSGRDIFTGSIRVDDKVEVYDFEDHPCIFDLATGVQVN